MPAVTSTQRDRQTDTATHPSCGWVAARASAITRSLLDKQTTALEIWVLLFYMGILKEVRFFYRLISNENVLSLWNSIELVKLNDRGKLCTGLTACFSIDLKRFIQQTTTPECKYFQYRTEQKPMQNKRYIQTLTIIF